AQFRVPQQDQSPVPSASPTLAFGVPIENLRFPAARWCRESASALTGLQSQGRQTQLCWLPIQHPNLALLEDVRRDQAEYRTSAAAEESADRQRSAGNKPERTEFDRLGRFAIQPGYSCCKRCIASRIRQTAPLVECRRPIRKPCNKANRYRVF